MYDSVGLAVNILTMLSNGLKLTVAEINNRLDEKVDVQKIQRILRTIMESGVHLTVDKIDRNKNQYSMPREYRNLITPEIQENELLSMYILKDYLRIFKGTNIEDSLKSILHKIESIAPGEVYDSYADTDSYMWEQDFGKFNYSGFDDLIKNVTHIIVAREWVEITYDNPATKTNKTFNVLLQRLFIYNGVLYIAAYIPKHDSTIALALHRIENLQSVKKNNTYRPDFDMSVFRKNRFGVFMGEIKSVRLKIFKKYAHYFLNRKWHASQKISKDKEGNLLLKMDVPLSPELLNWLLGWQSAITVLDPPELIETVKETLIETLRLYK